MTQPRRDNGRLYTSTITADIGTYRGIISDGLPIWRCEHRTHNDAASAEQCAATEWDQRAR